MSSFTVDVFNSLAPRGKKIIVTGILEQVDLQETVDGEVIWILRLVTNFFKSDGTLATPVYVVEVTEDTLSEEIRKGISEIASQIEWDNIEEDSKPPHIVSMSPSPSEENVNIHSNVQVRLRDSFPTVGIDPATIKLKVNGIDVTSELDIKGVDNEFLVTWVPQIVLET